MKKLPIVIGITGHRDIPNGYILDLKQTVKKQMQSIILSCPNTPIKVLTCLASGADQLCSEVAMELGIGVICVLPMELNEYLKDFKADELNKFNELLSKCENYFVAPKVEQKDSISRDWYYRQADIYVVEHCNCLLALWDGSDPKPNGCGTSETVDMAINHTYNSPKQINNDDAYVIHVLTPRNINLQAGEIKYLGNKELFDETINKIELLNKNGGNADELSICYGKKYHNMLKLLAVLGTAITIAFLLYDEAMIKMMLLSLGVILLFMYIAYKYADKSNYHEKYIEYRVFAECQRIQNHLNNTGYDFEVADYLDYSRCFDTLWVYKTMKVYSIFNEINYSQDIKNDWLFEQYNYHLRSIDKTDKLIKHNNNIVKTSMIVSIITYLFAIVFEYVIINKISTNVDLIRTIIKIIVGGFSAMSLFAANYYGKLSLQRVYEDHVRMADFFKKAIDCIEINGVNDNLIKEIINEELSENSNWCSYEKDNKIDLTV